LKSASCILHSLMEVSLHWLKLCFGLNGDLGSIVQHLKWEGESCKVVIGNGNSNIIIIDAIQHLFWHSWVLYFISVFIIICGWMLDRQSMSSWFDCRSRLFLLPLPTKACEERAVTGIVLVAFRVFKMSTRLWHSITIYAISWTMRRPREAVGFAAIPRSRFSSSFSA